MGFPKSVFRTLLVNDSKNITSAVPKKEIRQKYTWRAVISSNLCFLILTSIIDSEHFLAEHFLVQHFLMEHFLAEHFPAEPFLVQHFLVEHFLAEHFLVHHFLVQHFLVEHFLVEIIISTQWLTARGKLRKSKLPVVSEKLAFN